MFSLQTTENLFQLNSGKKVCHGISIQPCCLSLFTLPDVHSSMPVCQLQAPNKMDFAITFGMEEP